MAKRERITDTDIPRLMQTLACGTSEEQRHTLRLLCPCRNKVFDESVWKAIFRAFHNGLNARDPVRDAAKHALETLRERAAADPRWQELIRALTAQGMRLDVLDEHPPDARRGAKITSRDVPRLLETLACNQPDAQKHALALLCPCRNRRYDKQVWLEICRVCRETDNDAVRDQAHHAIGTLRERARTDPRSQNLLIWLSEQGVLEMPLETVLPLWNPPVRALAGGLTIPRWERARRSRTNRRR